MKIYVGKNNEVYEVGLDDLDKSPVLKSLVNSTGTRSPFIMHPELTLISPGYFHSVREFLLTDEYMPAIVNNPQGEDVYPKRLDNCTTPAHYQNEVLRAAHLYVIAKRLAIKTMQDLVIRKIKEAQYHKYEIKCLLDMAMVVFSRPEEAALMGKGKFKSGNAGNGEDGDADPLEKWLVEQLGSNFRKMMKDHAEQFFKVADNGVCSARGFGVKVLRWKVEFWDVIGTDVIAIEDDD